MIKKISTTLIFASLVAVSGFAGATPISGGVAIDVTACSILRDRVTVNVSAGVTAEYNCDTVNNVIRVGACHAAGSQKPTEVACVGTEVTTAEGTTTEYNGPGCTGAAGEMTTIEGRRVFTGRSTGGGVAAGSLDATTCTGAAVMTKISG